MSTQIRGPPHPSFPAETKTIGTCIGLQSARSFNEAESPLRVLMTREKGHGS